MSNKQEHRRYQMQDVRWCEVSGCIAERVEVISQPYSEIESVFYRSAFKDIRQLAFQLAKRMKV
jgi:hypothetical protein